MKRTRRKTKPESIDAALRRAMKHPGVRELMEVYEASQKWDELSSIYFNYQHPVLPSTASSSSELIPAC